MEILKEQNFDEKINGEVVLVDFFATWCGPCRMLSPILGRVAENFKGKVAFYKVDVDECEGISKRYGIMSIPTIILFKNGKEVVKNVGLMNQEQLTEFIEKHL